VRFHPGDICQIRLLPEIKAEYRGRECTVVSPLMRFRGYKGRRYEVRIQGYPGRRVLGCPHQLKPLPPPNTRSTWSEGVWQPKGLRNVINFDALLRTTE
jgi:hypothetical protein